MEHLQLLYPCNGVGFRWFIGGTSNRKVRNGRGTSRYGSDALALVRRARNRLGHRRRLPCARAGTYSRLIFRGLRFSFEVRVDGTPGDIPPQRGSRGPDRRSRTVDHPGVDSGAPWAPAPLESLRGPRNASGLQLGFRCIQPPRLGQLHHPFALHLLGPDSGLDDRWRNGRIFLWAGNAAPPRGMRLRRHNLGIEWSLLRLPRTPRHIGDVLGGMAIRRGRAHSSWPPSAWFHRPTGHYSRLLHSGRQPADRDSHPPGSVRLRSSNSGPPSCSRQRRWAGRGWVDP